MSDPDDLSPEDRAIAARIAALPDEPLPEGAEERMLDRFRREQARRAMSVAGDTDETHGGTTR